MRSLINYVDEALFSSASEFSKADKIDTEFVDLGLSVNWAKCNLGADEETDSGHYYMWGSTFPNDNDVCCWKNAPFNNGETVFDVEYFNSVKNKVCPDGKLAPEYDVAYKESKGDYRMPTKEEFDELIKKTDHEWVKNYDNTKINGIKFTNKKDESKYIFVPAGGFLNYYSDFHLSNKLVYLWSSTIHTKGLDSAYRLCLGPSSCNILIILRDLGFNIRPVR